MSLLSVTVHQILQSPLLQFSDPADKLATVLRVWPQIFVLWSATSKDFSEFFVECIDRREESVENGMKTLLNLVNAGKNLNLDMHEIHLLVSIFVCYASESLNNRQAMLNLYRFLLICHQESFHPADRIRPEVILNLVDPIIDFANVHTIDFEALTPNLLARTIETVEGGGLVVILLQSLTSLKQLYTMTMDVHSRYRTEAHQDIVARFNERFILSLASCKTCMVIDDQLNILPISCHLANIQAVKPSLKNEPTSSELELKSLKESMQDTQPIGAVINHCRTLDQAKCVLKFFDAITEKTLKATISLTAARGRGKSAALGLSIAGAVAFGYSNIFVTSPSPENLKTLFEFVFKGFGALEYQEHIDYELIQSTNPEFNKAIVRVDIFREHRQTTQYIHASDASKLGQAELLVIDEAAAIPLPLVKELMGPYLVFMASTVNGYEGTGRSLSLKLIQQLREQTAPISSSKSGREPNDSSQCMSSISGRTLTEITLEESIRYANGDCLEAWLNQLLCLDASCVKNISSGCPSPQDCDLYYIRRDTLFCFHKASEAFLQRLMSIYVAAHYKNSPNDLQMMSDAPAYQLYCLLGPVDPDQTSLPEILCVVQVCLEGQINKSNVGQNLSQGKRPSGDMIPWTVAQQFQDDDFPSLSGARIVRITTHPDYQGMGYGSRAISLLKDYFEGKFVGVSEEIQTFDEHADDDNQNVEADLLHEKIAPRKNLPPLLLKLTEKKAIRLDWLGVSFGLTNSLLRFWKKAGFLPVYLRQTASDLTGEHSCIMLKKLDANTNIENSNWLKAYFEDFRRRFVSLLGYQFSAFHPSLALSLLQQKTSQESASKTPTITRQELSFHITNYDLKRLEMYGQNLVDHHLITDLLPEVSRMYFLNFLNVHLSVAQSAILLGMGLQHKTVDTLSKELNLPTSQLLGLFNKTVRRIVQMSFFSNRLLSHARMDLSHINRVRVLNSICSVAIEENMITDQCVLAEPTKISLRDDLESAAKQVNKSLNKKGQIGELNDGDQDVDPDLNKFAIHTDDKNWHEALKRNGAENLGTILSVRRTTEVDEKGSKRRAGTLEDFISKTEKANKRHKMGKDKKFKKRKK